MTVRLTRRAFAAGSAAMLSSSFFIGRSEAQAASVTVATWGGNLLAAQRRHYIEPFQRETGVRVVVANEPSVARIKAMVDAGNVEWDVAQMSMAELLVMQRDNLLEPIDYSGFPREDLDALIPETRKSHGVGTAIVAHVIAFNTRSFPAGNRPNSWQDVWDTQRFRGPRSLNAMDFSARPLEAALVADGVEIGALYPMDIERAFRSLDRLKPHVSRWVTRGIDVADLMARGEVAVANASSARIIAMRQQGAPVDMTFNQALLLPDVWVIPRGSRNVANALRFIQFASTAQAQAGYSAEYPLGPVNRNAYRHLSTDQAALLPTGPGVLDKAIVRNAEWWDDRDAQGRSNTDLVAERWRRWVL